MRRKKTDRTNNQIQALVTPKSKVIESGWTNAELYRLHVSLGCRLKVASSPKGDLVLYSNDCTTTRRLHAMLPFMPMFEEQRLCPTLTPLEGIEIINSDEPIIKD